MKTALFAALIALSSQTSFAAPLAIEPSMAFSEAMKVAVDAARTQLSDPGLELVGAVNMKRAKNEAGRFADFKIEMNLDKFGGAREQHCNVHVFVARVELAELEGNVVVLETDLDAKLQTIARIQSVRCN